MLNTIQKNIIIRALFIRKGAGEDPKKITSPAFFSWGIFLLSAFCSAFLLSTSPVSSRRFLSMSRISSTMSLKQGEKNVLSEATILKRLGDNDYLAEVGGVKCHAIFNPFVGRYFVDDVYGIVRQPQERGGR